MGAMQNSFEMMIVIDKIRRLLFNVIERELHDLKIYDVTPIQLMMMYDLSLSQSSGDVSARMLYAGSNPAYNIRKTIMSGYAVRTRSTHDHRNFILKLSNKGIELCKKMEEVFNRDIQSMLNNGQNLQGQDLSRTLLNFLDDAMVFEYGKVAKVG